MNNYKKMLLGSVVAYFVGTSCCWLSSIAIWLGGAAILGTITSLIVDVQIGLMAVGVIFLIVTLYLYAKRRERGSAENRINGPASNQ